jgi:phosphomannomutase/phosphoglucomutase
MTPSDPFFSAQQFSRSGNDELTFSSDFLPKSLFREYDVRGTVDASPITESETLNGFVAQRLGRAFGTYLDKRGVSTVAIGHDSRSYSSGLASSVVAGLLSTGRTVVDIGLATSPLVYFAQHALGGTGCVSVTASHNPNGWAGFKFGSEPSQTLGSEEIQELHQIAAAGEFVTGSGQYREEDVLERYVEDLVGRVPSGDGFKVIVDGANSVSGAISKLVLERAGYDVTAINLPLDWTFPNHEPDPESVAARAQIEKAVVESGASAGVSFDGDGDRLGITDDLGNAVWADTALALLARDSLSRHPGAQIVFDVKCSRAVPETIEAAGGIPVMWKTGHSHIKHKAQELDSPLGGERSGHFFDRGDYYGYDDGTYSALRFLTVVRQSGKTTSELVAELPQYSITPTMHAECPEERKYEIVDIFGKYIEGRGPNEIVTINGIRAEFEDGWLLVRASSNLPTIVMVAEATTESRLREFYEMLREGLDQIEGVAKTWSNDPWG